MAQKSSLLAYKKGNSFLHKTPAWCKLLFIPLLNILFLCLPVYFSLGLLLIQFVIACAVGFSLGEQAGDLRPPLYYAGLLIFFDLVAVLFTFISKGIQNNLFVWNDLLIMLKEKFTWENQKESVFKLIKLFALMQSASLVFKSSSPLQLRDGIGKIEGAIRKVLHLKKENTFTDAISMFLNFIPMVSKIWGQSKRAWIARGGKKNSVKMFYVLLPVLFSVGMKKAWNETRAILIRK